MHRIAIKCILHNIIEKKGGCRRQVRAGPFSRHWLPFILYIYSISKRKERPLLYTSSGLSCKCIRRKRWAFHGRDRLSFILFFGHGKIRRDETKAMCLSIIYIYYTTKTEIESDHHVYRKCIFSGPHLFFFFNRRIDLYVCVQDFCFALCGLYSVNRCNVSGIGVEGFPLLSPFFFKHGSQAKLSRCHAVHFLSLRWLPFCAWHIRKTAIHVQYRYPTLFGWPIKTGKCISLYSSQF